MKGEVITYDQLQEHKREKKREEARKEEEERTPDGDMKLVLGEDSISE